MLGSQRPGSDYEWTECEPVVPVSADNFPVAGKTDLARGSALAGWPASSGCYSDAGCSTKELTFLTRQRGQDN